MVSKVKDVKELKKAIKAKRKEIIITDDNLAKLVKNFKSIKDITTVILLLVGAGLLIAAALPVILPALGISKVLS